MVSVESLTDLSFFESNRDCCFHNVFRNRLIVHIDFGFYTLFYVNLLMIFLIKVNQIQSLCF